MNLGTVAELHTKQRRIIPISFANLETKNFEIIAVYFGKDANKETYKHAFAELSFSNTDLYNETRPVVGEKIINKFIDVESITNYITEGNFVLRVKFNSAYYSLKCTTPAVPDSISRYGSNEYKTLIQHEVEGFLTVEKNSRLNGDFAKMYAYGNMWMGNDGQPLGPMMEVILMERLPYASLGLEYDTAFQSNDHIARHKILADAFFSLYTLHTKNVVHGNCNLNNLFRKKGKLVWIDPSRLIERKNLKITTWNTLKLMDIFVLLFAGYHALRTYAEGLDKIDLMQFRTFMGPDRCFILPNLIYKNRLFIFDDNSCAVLNGMFPGGVDMQFLAKENILDDKTLISFADRELLAIFTEKCYRCIRTVNNPAQPFSFDNFMRALNRSQLPATQSAQKSGRVVSKVTTSNPANETTNRRLARKDLLYHLYSPSIERMYTSDRGLIWFKIKTPGDILEVIETHGTRSQQMKKNTLHDFFIMKMGSLVPGGRFIISEYECFIQIMESDKKIWKMDLKYDPPILTINV